MRSKLNTGKSEEGLLSGGTIYTLPSRDVNHPLDQFEKFFTMSRAMSTTRPFINVAEGLTER